MHQKHIFVIFIKQKYIQEGQFHYVILLHPVIAMQIHKRRLQME